MSFLYVYYLLGLISQFPNLGRENEEVDLVPVGELTSSTKQSSSDGWAIVRGFFVYIAEFLLSGICILLIFCCIYF